MSGHIRRQAVGGSSTTAATPSNSATSTSGTGSVTGSTSSGATPTSAASSSSTNATSTSAAPSSSASSDPVSIRPLSVPYTCGPPQSIFWSYSGTSTAPAQLIIFTVGSTTAQQSQLINSTVGINTGFLVWPQVNVPGGKYALRIQVPNTDLAANSAAFDVQQFSGSNTSCLSSSNIRAWSSSDVGDGEESSTSGGSSSAKTSTIVPAVLVPVVVLSMLALGVMYFRKRRRAKNANAAFAYASSSRPPRGDGAYKDASGSPSGKHTWKEKFIGSFPSPMSPPRAGSKRQLNENDEGAFGYRDSYAMDRQSRATRDTWSEFGNDEDVESRAAAGAMPPAPQDVHHRRQESAASGRPASMRRQSSLHSNSDALIDELGIQHTEDDDNMAGPHSPSADFSSPPHGRRSESSNSAFGVKRKPVPNFSAARDTSAAYSHAASDGGNLIDVTSPTSAAGHESEFHDAHDYGEEDGVNPFADPRAPSAAFTVQRHHDASHSNGPTAY